MDLVTGASGFIGRHLAIRLLKEGRKVRVLCRPGSVKKLAPEIQAQAEVAPGDLTDRASIERATKGITRVFHCAGHVSDWGTEKEFFATNVQGTQWLLENSANVSRFVHLSSIAVFGVPSPAYFDDQSPYGTGTDLYSRTKIEGEKIAFRFQRERGIPVTVLRPAVVYGIFGTWFEEPYKMAQKNKLFLLGGGKGTCHPCYIENLIDAMLLVAEKPEAIGQAYIIGDNEPITFERYFSFVAELAGKPPIKRSIPLLAARAMATSFEAIAKLTQSRIRPLLTHTAIDMVCTTSRMSLDKIQHELKYKPRYGVRAALSDLRTKLTPAHATHKG